MALLYHDALQLREPALQGLRPGQRLVMAVQVRVALETETSEGLDIATLAFETGLSMEWVTDLCCTPLFYHRWGASPARAWLG